jgi:Xaa-Pro aminopeptidase
MDQSFQQFHTTTTPLQGRTNIGSLRERLKKDGLDAYFVPHEDEHQNEYLPEANERLAWLTGFTGSAGAAVIFLDSAVLFTDGRYTLQSRAQTDPLTFEHADFSTSAIIQSLSRLNDKARIGYDPRLIAPSSLSQFLQATPNQEWVACLPSPLDEAWGTERPEQPIAPVVSWALSYAGIDHAVKRHEIAAKLKSKGVGAALITAPASVAWLFNIRGMDVIRTPLPLAQALLHNDGRAELFIHPAKITDELRPHLGNEVSIKNPNEIEASFEALNGQKILMDHNLTSVDWMNRIEESGALPMGGDDPCSLARACKNETEIAGTKAAHVRDGAVMTKFLYWLAHEAQVSLPTEIEVAKYLESLRIQTGMLKDLSFDTISGFGPHGALPHYKVSVDSNLKTAHGSLLLVDSGAQYLDGTTDITRVVSMGEPSFEHKRMFTLVLKGHIALATAHFPAGTTGTHLDILARQHLWAGGFDYDHGTGHGVGVYLGVHEGPQRIAKAMNTTPLMPGMIVSNEPGFYKSGQYGIRIENLQYVTKPSMPEGGEREMMGFEVLTLAPIDRELIEKSMLTVDEIHYMDSYHSLVFEKIGPLVDEPVKSWLKTMCAPL